MMPRSYVSIGRPRCRRLRAERRAWTRAPLAESLLGLDVAFSDQNGRRMDLRSCAVARLDLDVLRELRDDVPDPRRGRARGRSR
jgi:hypothetical protein